MPCVYYVKLSKMPSREKRPTCFFLASNPPPRRRSIKLVIAKRWNDHYGLVDDEESHGYFPLPHQAVVNTNARQDPIRPIDPRQWIVQTNAVFMRRRSSLSPPPAASSTLSSSPPHSPCENHGVKSKSSHTVGSHLTPRFHRPRISLRSQSNAQFRHGNDLPCYATDSVGPGHSRSPVAEDHPEEFLSRFGSRTLVVQARRWVHRQARCERIRLCAARTWLHPASHRRPADTRF